MPRVITVFVDATVAIAFAADVGNPTGMKFIDLRQAWVMEMRDKLKCRTKKIPTKLNPADFMTKIHEPKEFRRQRNYFLYTPKYVRPEIEKAGKTVKLDKIESGSVMDKVMRVSRMYGGFY